MRRPLVLILASLGLASGCPAAFASPDTEREILVRFRTECLSKPGSLQFAEGSQAQAALARLGKVSISRALPSFRAENMKKKLPDGRDIFTSDLRAVLRIRLPVGVDRSAALAALQTCPDILYCEPNERAGRRSDEATP